MADATRLDRHDTEVQHIAHSQATAYRFRWALLLVGMFCSASGIWYLLGAPPFHGVGPVGTPIGLSLSVMDNMARIGLLFNTLLIVGVMLITQWLFLCPRGGLRMHLAHRGRPMWRSIVTAALAATLLSIGMVATLLELPGWWPDPDSPFRIAVWVSIGLVWIAWSILFYVYWRGPSEYAYLAKMLRWLIGGSILELIVAAPVHAIVWDRDEYDCYCARGSYTGLVLGGTVLVWAFGPGIVLLFVREKQRRGPLLNDALDN